MKQFTTGFLALAVAAVLMVPASAQRNDAAMKALEAARQKADVEGDIPGAMAVYEEVVRTHKEDRSIVVQALLGIAQCHQRVGNRDKAMTVYARIVRDYGDLPEAAVARTRTPGDGTPRSGGELTQKLLLRTTELLQFPTITGDERSLTYVPDGHNIAVRDLATNTTRLLVQMPDSGSAYFPLPSPDQKRIAFTVLGQGRHELKVGRYGESYESARTS